MLAYNYTIFPEDMDMEAFHKFPTLLKAGDAAPDGELTRLGDGARVKLSDYWQRSFLVVEFGSLT